MMVQIILIVLLLIFYGFIPSFPDLSAMIAALAVAGKELFADKGKGAAKETDASIETFDILAGIKVSRSSRLFLNPPDLDICSNMFCFTFSAVDIWGR
jgi:hypothetical protein